MFYKKNDNNYNQPAEGIKLKTLTYGEKTQLCEFKVQKGSRLPPHEHPHEQTGYLVSGKIVLIIEDQRYEAEPGDAWSIPGRVPHGAEVIEDAVVIEVFSPIREDYLPYYTPSE